MSTTITQRVSQPVYYHREYKNDIPNVKSEESQDSSLANQCKRVALVALPFISLYKPLSFPLSLAMGGLRTVTCVQQLLESMRSGNSKEIPYAMLQTAIAVIALAGTIFAHPLGMLISTGHDLIIDVVHLMEHLKNGEYQKAMEDCLGIINNALYLALFLHGGLEIGIASLAMQIFIGLYHSQAEFRKGHYIEGVGHLLMSMVRGNQLAGRMKLLQTKWQIEDSIKKLKELESRQNQSKLNNEIISEASALAPEKIQGNAEYINLLVLAKSENNDKLIDVLIKYGNNSDKIPILHFAIKCGDFSAVKILIENGSNVNLLTSAGKTPMHYAIERKDLEIMQYLLSNEAILDEGCIRIAALSNFLQGFDFLIANKAPFPTDADFLHDLLKGNKSQTIIIKLINLGLKCDVYFENRPFHGNLENVGLITLAIVRGYDFELIQLLIAKSAPVNDGTGSPYERPLWQAITLDRMEIAQYLILHGATVSDRALDSWIWNLRYYATLDEKQKTHYMSYIEQDMKLIERAADLKVFNQNRIQQIFEIGLEFDELLFVKKIFANGAKIHDRYLADVAKRGNRKLLEWLLENGAKP